jgi:hypothetical protein
MDSVERRIISTGAQLMILGTALKGRSSHSEEQAAMEEFARSDIPSLSMRFL